MQRSVHRHFDAHPGHGGGKTLSVKLQNVVARLFVAFPIGPVLSFEYPVQQKSRHAFRGLGVTSGGSLPALPLALDCLVDGEVADPAIGAC